MAAVAMSDGSAPGWLSVAERGSVLGIRLIAWLATAFGRTPARWVLRAVALYYFLFHASARRASAEYLARIHGRASHAMIYAHVLRFAEAALDRAFIVTGKFGYFEVTQTGHHWLTDLVAAGRGAILLGAHLGSFEAMRMQGDRDGLRINFLGYFRNARMINAALRQLNPTATARLIPIDPADFTFVLRIKERTDRGEFVAILGDRVGPDGRGATVDFLGGKADFPTGVYMLASILKCPIYLTFGLYRAPNRYELFCEPFEERALLPREGREEALRAYAQRFATRLEHFVRLAPDNWFNFHSFWRKP
jgi:predicted LPLAT superfamily acyltransferase